MWDSIIKSNQSEYRWVEQICKTFKSEFVIDIDDPPCVFKVPKSLRDTKPEAYAPQKTGIGPYHHLRPEFYMLQRNKLAAIKKFLTQEQFKNFQNLVLNRLVEIEPLIRTCYSEYFDTSGTTLAMILAIDGLYFLHILSAYRKGELTESAFPQLAKDLIMLENQIPSVVLNEIRFALHHIISKDDSMFSVYSHFCKAHSPLKLTEQEEFTYNTKSPHLLAYMYHLIVNNRQVIVPLPRAAVASDRIVFEPQAAMKSGDLISNVVGILDHIKGAETLQQHAHFIQSVPWQRISALFKKTKKTDENKPVVEEMEIPSVSQLHEIAEFEFKMTTGGIRDVEFNEDEHAIYLPVITLKADSEVILRNLVAYEAATATPESRLELAEYVDLMCGIVDTSKDVSLLRKAGIIEGDLNDEEIAEIFNGIHKSTCKNKKKSELEKEIDEVNEQFDNTFRVKVYRFLKKHIYKSWKFLTLLSTIVLLMLLTLQSFCEIYGCSDRWFGKSTA